MRECQGNLNVASVRLHEEQLEFDSNKLRLKPDRIRLTRRNGVRILLRSLRTHINRLEDSSQIETGKRLATLYALEYESFQRIERPKIVTNLNRKFGDKFQVD